jgi:antitoxin PrlF
VRETLGVEAGDKICYEVMLEAGVVVTRVEEDADPMVHAFLDFLERDMIAHPENIQPLSEVWMDRLKGLVGQVRVNMEESIEGDVDL